ncbi:spindle assembly checkpoint component Mad1 [Infundibulicybe gibba]|nr:spindle assembly checkpoint component Mad1 [Infundibulicybe gibba]
MNPAGRPHLLARSTTAKRDSLAAELERDPQLSSSKRQQRAQVFTSSMSHANLERQLVTAQTNKLELETKLRDKEMLVERLERDRQWLADREAQEREEKERERAEYEEEKKKTETELRSLRSSLTQLREEHADLEDKHASLSRTTAQTISAQKSQLTTLDHRCQFLEDELSGARTLSEERLHTIQELQEECETLRTSQDQVQHASAEGDMGVVREELHRQAAYLRELESVNAKMTAELSMLKERHASIAVLKEEKRGLEGKVKVMEELRAKVVRLEAEVAAGRREREEWADKVSASPSSAPSVSVTHSLSLLRLTHAKLLEEHGATSALLRRRDAELAELERREASSQATITSLESTIRALKEKVGRHDHRALLAEREIGFLQALVASFSAEEAQADPAPLVDTARTERVQQLETLLREYKAQNLELAREIDALGGDAAGLGQGKTRATLAADIDAARTETLDARKALEDAELEAKGQLEKIEELEQTLFELGGEIAGGRHVPPGVRILSLRDNPEQQWVDLRQAAMDRLKEENEALINRLKELEDSGARGHGGANEAVVPRESWEHACREKAELEDTVKQKDKRLLRLQQVFTSKSAEFREAIASILGLKLAFYPNGQVRVTSMFDLGASFVFQPASKASADDGNAGMRMQLVAQGEGGPQDLPQMMRYWIEDEQCIPGFLASVTLECYDKAKREREGAAGEEL